MIGALERLRYIRRLAMPPPKTLKAMVELAYVLRQKMEQDGGVTKLKVSMSYGFLMLITIIVD